MPAEPNSGHGCLPPVRLARLADARAIANTSRRLIEHGLAWRWRASRLAAHIRGRDSCVIVAGHGDELAGFACMSFGVHEAHLNLLGVLPTWQRRGLGSALLSWLEASALTAGIGVIRLEVRASTTACAFYVARGYRESRRRPGYYDGQETAIELARDLWCEPTRSANQS